MDVSEANSHAARAGLSRVDHVDVTGSTNSDLLDAVRHDPTAAVGRVLVADRQTAGRGRHGRRWEAPAASALLCSVVVEVGPTVDLSLVNTVLGLAGRAAVMSTTTIELGVKWPNDLVVVQPDELLDRKVAGVLSELAVVDGRRIVVAGIGINVSWPTADEQLPPELVGATSLAMLGAEGLDRARLLTALIDAMGARGLARLAGDVTESAAALMAEAAAASATLGRRVRVDRAGGGGSFVGLASELDDRGRLVVVGDERSGRPGEAVAVEAGDVHHLRVVEEPVEEP